MEANGTNKMLKSIAAKYAPLQIKNVAINVQPHPAINYNETERICELRLGLAIQPDNV